MVCNPQNSGGLDYIKSHARVSGARVKDRKRQSV